MITGHQFLYPLLIECGHLLRCHWPQTAPWLVMRVITTFSELSLHFPHHSITHGISIVYFTYLMNISQFHISCIQKTDNRLYFTVGKVLNHLEHFKHTEQYVHTICFSHIGISVLPVNEGRQCSCAKSWPQRCGRNSCIWYLLSKYASYNVSAKDGNSWILANLLACLCACLLTCLPACLPARPFTYLLTYSFCGVPFP